MTIIDALIGLAVLAVALTFVYAVVFELRLQVRVWRIQHRPTGKVDVQAAYLAQMRADRNERKL